MESGKRNVIHPCISVVTTIESFTEHLQTF